jgi:hypothetical protein
MKVLAEADLQVPITDILFTKPYIAVGTSVAVTCSVLTSQIAGLKNTQVVLLSADLILFRKVQHVWSRHRNLRAIVRGGRKVN